MYPRFEKSQHHLPQHHFVRSHRYSLSILEVTWPISLRRLSLVRSSRGWFSGGPTYSINNDPLGP